MLRNRYTEAAMPALRRPERSFGAICLGNNTKMPDQDNVIAALWIACSGIPTACTAFRALVAGARSDLAYFGKGLF